MMCLFEMSETAVKTNDDYRTVLKKRIRIFAGIAVIGFITLAAAIAVSYLGYADDSNDWLIGFYSGIGSGLILISIIKIVRIRQIMKDETLLKKERLKNYDERNRQIAAKAIQSSTTILLIISYVVMLISSFFDQTVFYCFWWIVILFTFLYSILFKYFSKKM